MEFKGRKLRYAKYDEKRYSEFIKEQARQLRERGIATKEAEASALEIAAMYRHHFRIWT
jgi:hypothetical protein